MRKFFSRGVAIITTFAGAILFAAPVFAQTYNYGTYTTSAADAATVSGFFAVYGLFILCGCGIAIAAYLFVAWNISRIVTKLGHADKAVMAWIPIIQLYVLAKAIGESDQNALLFTLAPFLLVLTIIPCIGWLAGPVVWVAYAVLWMRVGIKMGKDDYFGLLTLIPLVNFAIIYLIAEGTPKKS